MYKQILLVAALLAVVFCNVHLNKMYDTILDGSEPLTEEIAKSIYHEFHAPFHVKNHYRFKIFFKNLNKMRKHNMEKHSWTMGINDFADMTSEEITNQFLMEPMDCNAKSKEPEVKKVNNLNLHLDVGKSPVVFDWKDLAKMTDPKSQGSCGSSWAFAAVGTL